MPCFADELTLMAAAATDKSLKAAVGTVVGNVKSACVNAANQGFFSFNMRA